MGNGLRWLPEQLAEYRQRVGNAKVSADTPPETWKTKKKQTPESRERQKTISLFLQHIAFAGLPDPEREFRFHSVRKWRSDFAWPDRMLLAEYEGGIYTGGAHTRGKHYESDCEKYNEAALLGYTVLRFTVNLVTSGLALQQVERAFERTTTKGN